MRAKKIIMLLIGILAGILISVGLIGSGALAKTNEQIAADRLVERYEDSGILPSLGMAVGYTETHFGEGGPRYFGNMGTVYSDIRDSADQFVDLLLKYGDVACEKSFYDQACAMQRHGYYGGDSDYYVNYLLNVCEEHDYLRYDRKAMRMAEKKERRKERQRVRKKAKRRKTKQKGMFRLIYDPSLTCYQAVTYTGAIKGGAIRLRSRYDALKNTWLDIAYTKKGDLNVIYTGMRYAGILEPIMWLDEVREEAEG